MVKDAGYLSSTQWLTSGKPPRKALQGLARALSLECQGLGHTSATKDNTLLKTSRDYKNSALPNSFGRVNRVKWGG